MDRTPIQRLSIWRLKEQASLDDALSEKSTALKQVDFEFSGGMPARLITKQSPRKSPDWVKFLKSGIDAFNYPLETQSAAAVLLVEIHDRIFALTFGAGRFWVNKEEIDRRFGMMVTLNAVEENSLKSIDREEFEAQSRKTRTQTSTRSDIGQFGLDIRRDLLRSVTGKPKDTSVAEQLTGSDALNASVRIEFSDIPKKLETFNELAESKAYREKGYDWIDHFHRISDPAIIARLDQALVNDIREGNTANIFLAPPSTLDFQEHIGFLYPRERKTSDKHSDLRISDYISRVGPENIDVHKLKSNSIRHFRDRDDLASDQFSVYRAIVYERQEDNYLYVLTDGEYYRVDNDHVGNVQQQVMEIPLCNIDLPPAKIGEIEGEYNERACAENPAYFELLDRKTVTYGGQYSRIEVCDILTSDKKFVHVKPKIKSSTLSHLFNQGLVSAQCFADSRFRKKAADKCRDAFKGHFLQKTENSDYEIVFAIITTSVGDIRQALPFFSKQSLVNASTTIRGLGHPVCITKIGVANEG
ncbi:MAG: TIGR04141 family sporadically distributed protein [Erythrobacter sp.]|uniref:TIGR04141 family sporadically distributed protein n=1 Tax=Erythrobacter sp. TaxID=1042 RepID=UPI003A898387